MGLFDIPQDKPKGLPKPVLRTPAPRLASGWPMLPDVRGRADFRASNIRVELWREWFPPEHHKDMYPFACFVGMNPSAASADVDDKTIRMDMEFTRRLGYMRYCKVNLFGLCATEPGELLMECNKYSVFQCYANEITLITRALQADITVCCWGSLPAGPLLDHAKEVFRKIKNNLKGRKLYCYGTTQDGSPRHTSRLAHDTELVEWVGYL
jgi:hypothetical protein